MHKFINIILLLIILILIGIVLKEHKIISEIGKPQLPNHIKPVMFYNTKTEDIYLKGYDHFTYGLDSSSHVINIKDGVNFYYWVLYDMSIEVKIIKYRR